MIWAILWVLSGIGSIIFWIFFQKRKSDMYLPDFLFMVLVMIVLGPLPSAILACEKAGEKMKNIRVLRRNDL